ncbi:DUF4917 family protein [uncultured Hoeflea sp.]|uniref:DUF4917 family protein n=1 Tax=uncultured Hoeflea sp. TaxID=538666 RepID=UPI0030EC493F|tara:strand:+ start:142963 stop:143937 length:975 start_codon:yes stop_codon:yes gene_type:complete
MPDVITFQEAIEATKDKDRALMIGNGFSAEYFSYTTLLAESGLEDNPHLRDLFTALQTADFETVVRALEDAAIVERAYGNPKHSEVLTGDAQSVREGLVGAVQATHPAHREELDLKYDSSAAFLEHFGNVFTLNYDLLLYWVNLEKRLLRDGFGKGTDRGDFLGPFFEDAYCEIYNLHGGLHLFQDDEGEVYKALNSGDGVVATITHTIIEKKHMPIYVAEGSSNAKMRKINSVAYLRHCYDQLRNNQAASLFVYGHSADDNDAHIYRAVFSSEVKHVFFGVYQPDDEKLKQLDGQMAKHQKIGGKNIGYTFYDAESAHVWDAI